MIVCKFGGTSVKDSTSIKEVLSISKERLSHGVLLVSSAMGDSTDLILESCKYAERGDFKHAKNILGRIIEMFSCSLGHLVQNEEIIKEVNHKSESILSESRSLLKGISLLRNCSLRSRDALLSMGERLSTSLIWAAGRQQGIPCRWEDARNVVITNSEYGKAEVLFKRTDSLIKEILTPLPGELVITQGFIGSDSEGTTTTLGRGGERLFRIHIRSGS